MWLDGDKNDFIEACKRAWEQFDTQLNKRMMPMRAYKAHGGYYDSRGINIGYIVDKDKKSPTYNRYVIYEPHAEFIRWLYRRFIELSGSLALLAKEIEKQPIHFPWLADSYFNKKCPLSKIPGVGYRIGTWKTLKGILTNNVYIGVWKAGDDEYPGNHPAIIGEETWNTVQELMEVRAMKTQPITRKELSVLSGLIERPAPYWSVSIEPTTSSKSRKAIAFRFRPKGILSDEHTEEVHYDVVEETFRESLTSYVKEEDQCIEYAKEAARLYDREERNKQHIQETMSGLQARHQAIYNDVTDHTLAIPKQAKQQMYQEMADLETEIARLEAVLKRKKVTLDFPTILELIRKIKRHWNDIPVDLLHEFATIFTKNIRLRPLSPHLWEMCINWKIWGQDIYVIWQSASSHLVWREEERDALRRIVEEKSDIQEILRLLPRFSYDSIYTKCLDDYGSSPYPFHGYRLDSCLSLQDYDVLARYNIPMERIAQLKGMTVLARDREGNAYYRRAYDGRVKSQDGAFFTGHASIEELQG
jgi:hypothetical protein